MRNDFWEILSDSLDLLQQRQPELYRQIAELLADCELSLEIDGTPRALTWPGGQHAVKKPQNPAVEVKATRQAILQLCDGQLDLLTALREGHLEVRAPIVRVVAAFDALMLYLSGLSRIVESQALLQRYRGQDAAPQAQKTYQPRKT